VHGEKKKGSPEGTEINTAWGDLGGGGGGEGRVLCGKVKLERPTPGQSRGKSNVVIKTIERGL